MLFKAAERRGKGRALGSTKRPGAQGLESERSMDNVLAIVIILLSALLGSMIAWGLAQTVCSALERRRRVFALDAPLAAQEPMKSFARSRIMIP